MGPPCSEQNQKMSDFCKNVPSWRRVIAKLSKMQNVQFFNIRNSVSSPLLWPSQQITTAHVLFSHSQRHQVAYQATTRLYHFQTPPCSATVAASRCPTVFSATPGGDIVRCMRHLQQPATTPAPRGPNLSHSSFPAFPPLIGSQRRLLALHRAVIRFVAGFIQLGSLAAVASARCCSCSTDQRRRTSLRQSPWTRMRRHPWRSGT
jgi:hypothetical protein